MADATQHERWAPIPGYRGYEASDLGRVRSVDRFVDGIDGRRHRYRGRLLAHALSKCGQYPIVTIKTDDCVRQKRRVARLVLMAFVGPCPKGMEALHGNGVRVDSRLTNLRWGTRSENQWDQIRHGTHAETNKTHCPRGHELVWPNLAEWHRLRGSRTCQACALAHGRINYCRRQGYVLPDFGITADAKHEATYRKHGLTPPPIVERANRQLRSRRLRASNVDDVAA